MLEAVKDSPLDANAAIRRTVDDQRAAGWPSPSARRQAFHGLPDWIRSTRTFQSTLLLQNDLLASSPILTVVALGALELHARNADRFLSFWSSSALSFAATGRRVFSLQRRLWLREVLRGRKAPSSSPWRNGSTDSIPSHRTPPAAFRIRTTVSGWPSAAAIPDLPGNATAAQSHGSTPWVLGSGCSSAGVPGSGSGGSDRGPLHR